MRRVDIMAANIMAIFMDTPDDVVGLGNSWYSDCAGAINGPDFNTRAAIMSLPPNFMMWQKNLPLLNEALRFRSMYRQSEYVIGTLHKILDGEPPHLAIGSSSRVDFYHCLIGNERSRVPLDVYSKRACLGWKCPTPELPKFASHEDFIGAYLVAFDKLNDPRLKTPARLMACVRHSTYRHGYERPGVAELGKR